MHNIIVISPSNNVGYQTIGVKDFLSCNAAWSFSIVAGTQSWRYLRNDQGKYIPVDNRAQHQKPMFHQLSISGASQRPKSF